MSLKNLFQSIFFRFGWVYLISVIGLSVFVDQKVMASKTFDMWQKSAGYVYRVSSREGTAEISQSFYALQYYQNLEKLMGSSAYIDGAIGQCYVLLTDQDKAMKHFKKALDQNPSLIGLYHNIGLLYARSGRWEEAQRWVQKGLKEKFEPQTVLETVLVNPNLPEAKTPIEKMKGVYLQLVRLNQTIEKKDAGQLQDFEFIYYAIVKYITTADGKRKKPIFM